MGGWKYPIQSKRAGSFGLLLPMVRSSITWALTTFTRITRIAVMLGGAVQPTVSAKATVTSWPRKAALGAPRGELITCLSGRIGTVKLRNCGRSGLPASINQIIKNDFPFL